MKFLNQLSWEATHITVMAGAIGSLALLTCLIGVPRGKGTFPNASTNLPTYALSSSLPAKSQAVPAARQVEASTQRGTTAFQQSDPREVIVGASGISNRYRLMSVERKSMSLASDQLTLRLHIESLAMEPLVSPFESDMLEIRSPGLQPIAPSAPFRLPIPSGNSRNQDIVFNIPQGLNLNSATLRIHYYYYENEIPLKGGLGEELK